MKHPTSYMELTVAAPGVTDEHFDDIADALYDCGGVIDPDLSANFKDETLTFHMGLEGPMDAEEAVRRSIAVARTAIHAAGGGTSGWDNIRLVNLSAADDDRTLEHA